jgi:transposase
MDIRIFPHPESPPGNILNGRNHLRCKGGGLILFGGSPMWTSRNRGRYDRSRLRYPSDATDEEWALVEPLIPPAKRGGNRRHFVVREVIDGLMYILSTGCQWRAIPKDLPPGSTLYRLFRSVELGRHARSHPRCALYAVPPSRDHRQPERQEHGKRGLAIDSSGYDAGKKIKGKKRHILVDTQGLLMHAADVQDRDGGALLMASLFGAFPFLVKLYADGGYQGPEFQSAMKRILARVPVEIVKRSGQGTGFIALPKSWIVERTFAWLGRCRRLAKDWECLNHKALAESA